METRSASEIRRKDIELCREALRWIIQDGGGSATNAGERIHAIQVLLATHDVNEKEA